MNRKARREQAFKKTKGERDNKHLNGKRVSKGAVMVQGLQDTCFIIYQQVFKALKVQNNKSKNVEYTRYVPVFEKLATPLKALRVKKNSY